MALQYWRADSVVGIIVVHSGGGIVGLSERSVGQVLILKPNGRLDSQSAPEFEIVINQKLATARQVILDLADVPYVSSAGLRVVLLAAKRVAQSEGRFALASLKPEIFSVFRISGVTHVLKIFATPEAALAEFGVP
jgi:anti-anti-sigma factor